MAQLDTLSEVILYVDDIDSMTDFYTNVLDLEISSGAPEYGFVAFDTGTCELCLHAGRDGEIGQYAPKVVFEVDDIDAARSELQANGIEMSEIRNPTPGTNICDALDPEGNRFSIESSG